MKLVLIAMVLFVSQTQSPARRMEGVEYELYDSNGYLKGSVTYGCAGGRHVEGDITIV